MSMFQEDIEQHFGNVADALREGTVVPLLGAGVNLCDPGRRRWEPGRNLPSGRELAEHLAEEYGYAGEDSDNLLRISQYAQDMRGDGTLRDKLHLVFDTSYEPTVVHRFLAGLPAELERSVGRRQHQLIVTTNYDDALEKAMTEAGEPFDLLWYSVADCRPGQPGRIWHKPPDGPAHPIKVSNEDPLSVAERTVILKIHGAVMRIESVKDVPHKSVKDSYVISEDHYIAFLTNTSLQRLIPPSLMEMLLESHFLFLGYSLQDWNLRVILHRIFTARDHARDSWAIQKEVHEMDRMLWGAREVNLHELGLDTYVKRLDEHVGALSGGQPVL